MSLNEQQELKLLASLGRVEDLENELAIIKADILKQVAESGDTMTGKLTINSAANGLIDLNPSSTGTQDVINITPTRAIGGVEWDGIRIDGGYLDPSAIESEIHGLHIDLSGVDETYAPHVDGLEIAVPPQQDAIHIAEGQLHIDYTTDDEAAANYTGIDMVVNVNQTNADLQSSSEFHALDVAIADGTPAGDVAALGTHPGVAPIHQHIGTYTTPSQTEYAARFPNGGSWTDGIDGNEIFVADDDAIYIGHTAKFDELQVIMTTAATKDVFPEFHFRNTSNAWIEFFPGDDTDGFQQDGTIRWNGGDFTDWKSDYDPGGGGGSAGYYIKIQRTRVSDPGSPTPTTIKYLVATPYEWDKDGALSVASIASAGTLTVQNALPAIYFSETDATDPNDAWRILGSGSNFKIAHRDNSDAATDTHMTFYQDEATRIEYPLKIKEAAAALGDTATYGQLWVKNTDPNELWFTDGDGTDTKIA